MRLGQLSRKINIKTSDIIDYLNAAHRIEINNHPNSKIPEEYLELIDKHFGVNSNGNGFEEVREIETSENETILPQEVIEETVIDSKTEEIIETKIELEETSLPQTKSEEEELDLIIVDGVIKAPKIELTGPKVVGKIDLPQPKADEVVNEETNESEAPTSEEVTTIEPEISIQIKPERQPRTRNDRQPRDRKNIKRQSPPPLTPDEERKLKLKEAQRQKIEAKQSQKAKRRERYHEGSKAKLKTQKSSELKKKNSSKSGKPKRKNNEAPKSLWGKFIYWLNN
jgi:hypothetical protein